MAAEAWVTLATNDSYAIGVLVLGNSLKEVDSTRPLVVMISDQVSPSMREKLGEVCSQVVQVNVLDSRDSAHLALLARPELGITFTKLHCWTLTQFSKCVFLDADTLVIRNCDELFEREELSAASDAGWPDCFNSGVFVFSPSTETYSKLIEFAVNHGSFDGGDQGLLNSYFSEWATKDISQRLPFIYNMTASAVYSYRPAYKQYGKEVRIVHFIGSPKPWQVSDNFPTVVDSEHVNVWWDIFRRKVQPLLSPTMIWSSVYLHNETSGLAFGPEISLHPLTDSSQCETAGTLLQKEGSFKTGSSSCTDVQSWTKVTCIENKSFNSLTRSEQNSPPVPSNGEQDCYPNRLLEDKGVAAQLSVLSPSSQPSDQGQNEAGASAISTGVGSIQLSQEEKESQHRAAWESGNIDYAGQDAFDNIMEKMQKTINGNKKP